MTKQEIITLLIKDYEEAIEKCKGMRYEDIHDYLRSNYLIFGVCFLSKHKYYFEIGDFKWVDENMILGWYWTKAPAHLFNKKSIIQSLQTRLSILKTELEIPE